MRRGPAVVLFSLVAANLASAEDRNPAIRVLVQAAGGGAHGSADSALDVQDILRQQKPDSILAIAASREAADLVVEITGRHTEKKMDYGLTPPIEVTFYIVQGAALHGDRSRPVQGETSVIIKSWREAAAYLVGAVADYAGDEQHLLLRRRADWPDVGFEFEELTKERKKQFGAKDGKAVVTAVRAEGAAQAAGLQVGDAVLTLGGKKLKNPGELARAIYGGTSAARLSLEVAQRGSRRTVTLAIP